MGSVNSTVVGASVGAVLGAIFIAILITCIIYINKKLVKRTNSRSKLVTSTGEVFKDKWALDVNQGYKGDKRSREEVIIPPPPPKLIPPAPAPRIIPPPILPEPPRRQTPPRTPPTPPKLRRYKLRSWPRKEQRPPAVDRKGSIGHQGGVNYFIYGMPYPVANVAYPVHQPPMSQSHLPPPPPEPPEPLVAPPRRRRNPYWMSPVVTNEVGAVSQLKATGSGMEVVESQEIIIDDISDLDVTVHID